MIEQKNAYKHVELIECAKGNMFGEGNAQLPNTGMLMFDEIVENLDMIGRRETVGRIVAVR